jgi:hypothetical protein
MLQVSVSKRPCQLKGSVVHEDFVAGSDVDMSFMKGDPAQAAIRASTFPIDGGIIPI